MSNKPKMAFFVGIFNVFHLSFSGCTHVFRLSADWGLLHGFGWGFDQLSACTNRFSADWGLLHGFGWGFDQISACTKPSTDEFSRPHGRGHKVSSKGLTLETHLWADQGTLALGSTWLPFEVGIHFQSSSHSHFANYKVFIFTWRISLWIETFLFDSLNCSIAHVIIGSMHLCHVRSHLLASEILDDFKQHLPGLIWAQFFFA
jgi:hypothetical protein